MRGLGGRMDFQFDDGKRRVVLDADVAEAFEDSAAVNNVLRSVIRAMRTAGTKNKKTPAKRRAS
ncbi:MAG TPA: hypothetical protein VM733_23075 [Thermoanaerobaculia bacterium]|nr:hypothetical protein [Thermoanaerobaculia bacterium]